MKDEWWNEVERIYHAARELHGVERSRFLDSACEPDSAIFRQVDEMLRNEEQDQSFLVEPAIDVASPSVVSQLDFVLSEGTQLGPYQVLGSIGSGGMGQVYRARDTRLKRDVAIKAMSEEFARDPERLARFDREAKVLASLNHPNIAGIHDVVECDGSRYLVLELVDGITLADRLSGGPCTVEETVKIGVQLAEALEVAHERGIVHRDLKPANVKVTAEGKVKVLDFGLAKTFHSLDPGSDASAMRTQKGDVVGTPAYMSPEQARGLPVDRRADIWAFGCVIYELLTGRKAFPGATASDTIAAILTGAPDWTALPPSVPIDLQRLLRRCLSKDLRRRIQNAGDIRIELEEMDGKQALASQTLTASEKRSNRFLWAALVSLLALIAVFQFVPVFTRPAPVAAEPVRFFIYPPDGYTFVSYSGVDVSPDGRYVAFPVRGEGRDLIGLRALNSATSRVLEGTDGVTSISWSPDSRSVAFVKEDKLKTLDIFSGVARTLCDAFGGGAGTWNRDGVIVFSGKSEGGGVLYRVGVDGGNPQRLELAAGIYAEGPTFLPDGRHFIFNGTGSRQERGVYLGVLGSKESTRLPDIPLSARFAPPGYIVFERNGTTYAQSFDTNQNRLTGQPIALGERTEGSVVSFSDNGVMVVKPQLNLDNQLVWFDRRGNMLEAIGPAGDIFSPEISHDGKTIAAVNAGHSIRLIDARTGVSSPWTSSILAVDRPVWSKDDMRIVFGSLRGRTFDLYEGSRQGSGDDSSLLWTSTFNKRASDWSRNERLVLYEQRDSTGHWDLWTLALPEKEPTQLTKTAFDERQARFSPDGQFIAYASNESGEYQVWVRHITSGFKQSVSRHGGVQPSWSPDGKELFYIGSDENLMSVTIQDRSTANQPALAIGEPVRLFKTALFQKAATFLPAQYAVADDGQRFLLNTPIEGASAPITVILNWTATLKSK